MGPSTAWELSSLCDSPVATVVFHMVTLGVWSNDARVDGEVAETICALLRHPEAGRRSSAAVTTVDLQTLAGALLSVDAYETPISLPELAAASRGSVEALRPAVLQLEAAGLIEIDRDGAVSVPPALARSVRALADGELTLDDVSS